MVIAKKLRWFGHVTRSNSMSKIILQDSIEDKRTRGRPKFQWQDNIVKWTGIDINKAMRAAENREEWKQIVTKSTTPLWHPNDMGYVKGKR